MTRNIYNVLTIRRYSRNIRNVVASVDASAHTRVALWRSLIREQRFVLSDGYELARAFHRTDDLSIKTRRCG